MWSNPQFPVDLVTITEEIFNGKLHFLCSVLQCWSKVLTINSLTFWAEKMYGKFNKFEVRLKKLTMVPCGCIEMNIGLILSNNAFTKYM